MLFEKDGKRNSNTEWRIYYADDTLPSSSPRVYKSFTFVQDNDWRFPHYDALPSPVILNEDKNAVGESQKTATWHRVKNLLRWWHLTVFLATSVQILHVRSGWRLTLSSLWRLTVPGHSEWTQECCLRKTGNGTVTRSEESITRMTSYRLPHHGNRSFTFVQDDDWRFPHYSALPSPVILNEDKNAVGESQKTATWHRVKNLLLWWRLAANS